jgi:hypothetical protein
VWVQNQAWKGGKKGIEQKNISENELKTKLFWGFLAQTPYMKYIQ